MTDPTREQIDESSVHSDKSLFMERLAEIQQAVASGEFVMAQTDSERIEELERQIRCVQLYGYGYLLNHGGKQIALDPKDVTVVLPSTRHMDDFDLHNSLHLTEQKLATARQRIDELEDAAVGAFFGEQFDEVIRERDEARQQVQVLQDRIAKVREICAEHSDCDQAFGEIVAVLDGRDWHADDEPDLGDSTEDAAYGNAKIADEKPVEYRDPDCWIDDNGRMQCNKCDDQVLAMADEHVFDFSNASMSVKVEDDAPLCSCTWTRWPDFWAGDLVWVHEIEVPDKRCPEHGKPRWSSEEKRREDQS